MLSIFSPRVNIDKKGVVTLRSYSNDKVFDKYYLDPIVKKKVKKIGDSDEDFIIEESLIFEKRDIEEVINSQKNLIPDIDESIKRFAETGDLTALPPGMEDGKMVDYTLLPEDHASYMAFMSKVEADYDALDPDLKKNMTMAEFVNKITNESLMVYYNSIKPFEKKGDDKDE